MKKINQLILCSAILALIFNACKKDEDTVTPAPSASIQLILGAPQVVTDTSIRVKVTLRKTGNPSITSRGICWDSIAGVSIAKDTAKAALNSDSVFYVNMKGLTPGVKYYVKAFATTSAGVSYSDEKVYFTSSMAILSIDSISVSFNSAQFKATITQFGSPIITDQGFCWGSSINPSLSANLGSAAGALIGSSVSVTTNNLTPGNNYHLRAYATINGNTIYSPDTIFSSDCVPPVFSSLTFVNLRDSSVVLKSNVTYNCTGVSYGFCWDSTTVPVVSTAQKVTCLLDNGKLRASVAQLKPNQQYHVRAYVQKGNNVLYGPDTTFKTLPSIGASYMGGNMGYIFKPTDPSYVSANLLGYDSLVPHGLIVNPILFTNFFFAPPYSWLFASGYIQENPNGGYPMPTRIGSGFANTNNIFASIYYSSNYTHIDSYNFATNFNISGSNWFVPSIDEMTALMANYPFIAPGNYWTSNQVSQVVALFANKNALGIVAIQSLNTQNQLNTIKIKYF